ncbi:MAG: hypothetical protein M1368_09255, partial [Thaumarchaeota archaeon]|nr:hypothetical protein [Nitrososphaerota archaeon]
MVRSKLMQALVYGQGAHLKDRKRLTDTLTASGISWGDLTTAVSSDKADADVLLVVGGDHAVVEANSLF